MDPAEYKHVALGLIFLKYISDAIESDILGRQGKAITNFQATLPPPQSDLAQQVLKDPYNFEFLTLAADARERELERGLLAQLRRFLLELGAGFAFVGEQHPIEVAGEDFYLLDREGRRGE